MFESFEFFNDDDDNNNNDDDNNDIDDTTADDDDTVVRKDNDYDNWYKVLMKMIAWMRIQLIVNLLLIIIMMMMMMMMMMIANTTYIKPVDIVNTFANKKSPVITSLLLILKTSV